MTRTALYAAAGLILAACGGSQPAPEETAQTPPPNPDRDPATRAPTADLPDDYLLHSWTAKGVDADCAMPDFQITENMAGGLIIETRLNGSPATGPVNRAGPGGSQASFVFENSEFPIERRGVDGLAVMPPTRAPDRPEPMRIAGNAIAGDGVVFIQCAES